MSTIKLTHTQPKGREPLARLASAGGWLLLWLGALMEVLYHGPELLLGTQWPPTIQLIGEFGHTIVFAGIVIVIFSVLQKHSGQR